MTISDLVNKVYFLTNTNSTSFPAADMLILVNNAYERAVSLIMQADNRWQWDDSNQTDLPIATTTLTANQQDYSLAVTHLNIIRVETKDTSGVWTQLQPLDINDFKGVALSEFFKTAGKPIYYDKFGSTVMLYPAPDYTQTASLKIQFQRPPALYTSAEVTTGTKVPGFNSLYHDLIPYWVSYDYSMAKGLNQKLNPLMAEITRKEEALTADYSTRNRDEQKIIKSVKRSSR